MNFKTVFKDDFSSLPLTSIIKSDIRDQTFGKWVQTSHHYSWKSKRLPNYQISPLPWRVVEQDGALYLEQPEKWDNVIICAGNIDWRDYILKTEVVPLSLARCGILFHYQTSRHNYYIAFENGRKISLYKRFDDNLTLLDSSQFQYKIGEKQNVEVTIDGEMIQVSVNRKKLISLCDSVLGFGKIGLRSDGPVRYGVIAVSMEQEAEASFNILREKRKRLIDDKKNSLSKPSLVKQIPVNIEADYLQLDDLSNKGTLEVVFIKQYCTGVNKTSISYFGVADINGNTIWSHGEPKDNLYPIHSDIAFNLGDIDGDGNKEMIMTQDSMLKIFDATTGELKNEIPTPGNEHEKNIIGDSILLSDLEGKGAKQNIILKDRYQNIWAYDNNLNLLWTRRLNTGHYPRAIDINGDGREEIMAGYSMLNADGETMWTVPGADPYNNVWREPPHTEHADSIWIGRFSEEKNAPVQVAIAASDMGFLLLDANSGELISQDKCGHAQSLAIGKFRKELPGYQFAVSNLWGNPGILTLFDCKGNRLACKEYPPFEVIVPVNWRGKGEADFLGITTRRMYDRDLEPVFRFPKENKLLKTSVRPLVDDFLGLGIDQLAFLNGNNIEIFKPEKYGNIKMKHNTENFNFYGAFFLEYSTNNDV